MLLRSSAPIRILPTEDLQASLSQVPAGSEVVLAAGNYDGPVVVDKPLTITGTDGTRIVGGPTDRAVITVASNSVSLTRLSFSGGNSGIVVRESEDVLLSDLTVDGADLHGIEIVDSSARIVDVLVDDLQSPMAQGIEIRNSDGRPDSVVSGSVIRGGQEGIVSHVSEVIVQDNLVESSTMRGITITEMSDGIVSRNEINGAAGTALYCGDMSRCRFENNVSGSVAASGLGRSGEGWGLVVTYHAAASSEGDEVSGVAGSVFTSLGGRVQDSTPLEIGAGWGASVPILLATLAALFLLGLMFLVAGPLLAKMTARRTAPTGGGGAIWLALVPLLAIQSFHMFEHTLQVFRVRVDGVPSRGGVVGPVVEAEWIHFIYNAAVLALLVLIFFARRPERAPSQSNGGRFLLAGALVQGYHVIEHTVKLSQHLITGAKVNPGLAGKAFDLVLFHYAINLMVYLALLSAVGAYLLPTLREKVHLSKLRPLSPSEPLV